jgi:hypothetical protein
MRILVVIFALLGMMGTGLLGFAVQTALDETQSDGGLSAKEMAAQLDEAIAQANALGIPDKEATIAGLEAGKSAVLQIGSLPIVFFGAAAIGFILMLLSVLKIGPKPVHGGGLILAGIVPVGFTWSILSAFTKLETYLKSIEPNAKAAFSGDEIQTAQLFILACCGGLVLSGICAFFVKRD